MAEANKNLEKEAPLRTKIFQQWKGVFTQASRNAIPADRFYNLQNLQPIGDANLHTVNGISGSLVNYGADTIYWSVYVNLNSTDYLINFASDGKVFAFNIGTSTSSQITPLLASPSQNAITTATSGGSLAANTYYYKITALNGAGETTGSNEQSVATTGATSSNTLSWAAIPGATGYRVYRGTSAGGENVFYAPGNVTTFVDTGAASTGGTPPVTNTATVLFSGAGSRCTQWNDNQILFVDSTGYYHWDGTTFQQITGTGVPSAGTEIAVYSGRVWIWNGRLLVVGDVGDYTAAAFLAANGAIFIALTDPTLRSTVVRAIAANGYLYFAGNSSINVISNVYIPSGASPPAPLLTNQNIQSLLGSDQPGSFFVVGDRDLFFANSYGVHRLRGVSADRVSADIDGTWQYRDSTLAVSGGGVISNNILNAALLLKTVADPIDPVYSTPQTLLCMYADDKWWFANYGALTLVTGALANNVPALFGFIGNQLYQLFQSSTSSPTFTFSTALWGMEDLLANKQVIRVGVEMTMVSLFTQIALSVDTPSQSKVVSSYAPFQPVQWINSSGAVVTWLNFHGLPVEWFAGGFLLTWGDGEGYARYVGVTCSGQAIGQISGVFMDYKIRNRWGGGLQ